MCEDENNYFLFAVRDFIQNNFNDFIEYESGLTNCTSKKIQNELRIVIDRKISDCIAGIWVFKMGSEGHFSKM